ncbi:hypothetical protein PALB_6910 [Pseudoalteromonas luteoviolacea B = ATCC 29581]|nr:hypothetical protein PALB_6910 [Pseudoalteromonas luteoviolacea B = ATCC 29581]
MDNISDSESSLIDIAVEGWRFSKTFAKVLQKLDAGEAKRYQGQLRYFHKKIESNLEAAGLKLVDLEGQPYDSGMAVSAINMEDFDTDDYLIIDQMMEPVLMAEKGIRKEGVVLLKKVEL